MKNKDKSKEKTKTKAKSNSINFLIAFLIIIILILASISVVAWARYNSRIQQNETVEVAKWSFQVTGNGEQSVDNINFAITRTDTNRNSRNRNYCTWNLWQNCYKSGYYRYASAFTI